MCTYIMELESDALVESEQLRAVINKHRTEPELCRQRVYEGLRKYVSMLEQEDVEARADLYSIAVLDLKTARMAAETLDIIQKMERRAWSLDDVIAPQTTIVIERSYV